MNSRGYYYKTNSANCKHYVVFQHGGNYFDLSFTEDITKAHIFNGRMPAYEDIGLLWETVYG